MPVQFRAKTADNQAGLEGATWTEYQSVIEGAGNAVDNIVGSNRWCRLEAKLTRGSEPEIDILSQNYGQGC